MSGLRCVEAPVDRRSSALSVKRGRVLSPVLTGNVGSGHRQLRLVCFQGGEIPRDLSRTQRTGKILRTKALRLLLEFLSEPYLQFCEFRVNVSANRLLTPR
jgi:hypothetical protein